MEISSVVKTGWYGIPAILHHLGDGCAVAVLEAVLSKGAKKGDITNGEMALPLVNRGAKLNPPLCNSCNGRGITQLAVVIIPPGIKEGAEANRIIDEECEKWERKKEDAKKTAEEKAIRLSGLAATVYRDCEKLLKKLGAAGKIPKLGQVDRELAVEIIALGKTSAGLVEALREAVEDLLNGEGSVLVKVEGITPPSEAEAKQALRFMFDVLKLANGFNVLHRRFKEAVFFSDVSLFDHEALLMLSLAAFFADSAFWGGWQGRNHEERSAEIYGLIRSHRPSLPDIELLLRNHSRNDWIGCVVYRQECGGLVSPIPSNHVRDVLCLALTEEFLRKTGNGKTVENILEDMATRYAAPPSPFHDSKTHGSAGLPLYVYILAALCNLKEVIPKGAIVEFFRDTDSKIRPSMSARFVGLGGGICGVCMEGSYIWLFWKIQEDGSFQILEMPSIEVPDRAIIILTTPSIGTNGCPKQVLLDLGAPVESGVYRPDRRWVIGFCDSISLKSALGHIETILPKLRSSLANRRLTKEKN